MDITNNTFSMNRFLTYSKFILKFKLRDNIILFTILTFIIVATTVLYNIYFQTDNQLFELNFSIFNNYAYYLILYVLGFQLATISFSSIKKSNSSSCFLLTPVSNFERYISHLLIHSIMFFIVFTFIYLLGSLLGGLITSVLFSTEFKVFNPFWDSSLKYSAIFFSLQLIFFSGGLFFNKNESIKTVLFVAIYYAIQQTVLSFIITVGDFNMSNTDFNYMFNQINNIMYSILFISLPILCFIAGYYRLKEKNIQR